MREGRGEVNGELLRQYKSDHRRSEVLLMSDDAKYSDCGDEWTATHFTWSTRGERHDDREPQSKADALARQTEREGFDEMLCKQRLPRTNDSTRVCEMFHRFVPSAEICGAQRQTGTVTDLLRMLNR